MYVYVLVDDGVVDVVGDVVGEVGFGVVVCYLYGEGVDVMIVVDGEVLFVYWCVVEFVVLDD